MPDVPDEFPSFAAVERFYRPHMSPVNKRGSQFYAKEWKAGAEHIFAKDGPGGGIPGARVDAYMKEKFPAKWLDAHPELHPDADGGAEDGAGGGGDEAGGEVATVAKQRAAKLKLTREQARNVELKNRQLTGELISAPEIAELWARAGGILREKLLAMPRELAPKIAGATAEEVEAEIGAHVHAALEAAAEAVGRAAEEIAAEKRRA